jgi:F0F1-type ATP synthase assembly protein I
MAAQERRDEGWSGMGTGWAITSTMIGGIATLGLVGYLIDRLLGTEHVFVAIGFVAGAAAGVYSIWLRYGRGEGGEG